MDLGGVYSEYATASSSSSSLQTQPLRVVPPQPQFEPPPQRLQHPPPPIVPLPYPYVYHEEWTKLGTLDDAVGRLPPRLYKNNLPEALQDERVGWIDLVMHAEQVRPSSSGPSGTGYTVKTEDIFAKFMRMLHEKRTIENPTDLRLVVELASDYASLSLPDPTDFDTFKKMPFEQFMTFFVINIQQYQSKYILYFLNAVLAHHAELISTYNLPIDRNSVRWCIRIYNEILSLCDVMLRAAQSMKMEDFTNITEVLGICLYLVRDKHRDRSFFHYNATLAAVNFYGHLIRHYHIDIIGKKDFEFAYDTAVGSLFFVSVSLFREREEYRYDETIPWKWIHPPNVYNFILERLSEYDGWNKKHLQNPKNIRPKLNIKNLNKIIEAELLRGTTTDNIGTEWTKLFIPEIWDNLIYCAGEMDIFFPFVYDINPVDLSLADHPCCGLVYHVVWSRAMLVVSQLLHKMQQNEVLLGIHMRSNREHIQRFCEYLSQPDIRKWIHICSVPWDYTITLTGKKSITIPATVKEVTRCQLTTYTAGKSCPVTTYVWATFLNFLSLPPSREPSLDPVIPAGLIHTEDEPIGGIMDLLEGIANEPPQAGAPHQEERTELMGDILTPDPYAHPRPVHLQKYPPGEIIRQDIDTQTPNITRNNTDTQTPNITRNNTDTQTPNITRNSTNTQTEQLDIPPAKRPRASTTQDLEFHRRLDGRSTSTRTTDGDRYNPDEIIHDVFQFTYDGPTRNEAVYARDTLDMMGIR